MAFKNCYKCLGNAKSTVVIKKFDERECGHVFCLKCRITHDGDVDEISTESMSAEDIQNIESDAEYKKLFVETSNVRSEEGDDYAAFDWEDQKELREGVSSHIVESIEKFNPTGEPIKILDIGCASGFTSVTFADKFPNSKIVSIDPSPQVKGIDGYNSQITAVQSTLQGTSFGDEKFDVAVIIGNVMLHQDPLDTLTLALDTLRPGGLLIFDFKNIKSSPRVLGIWLSRIGLANKLPKSLFDRNFLNMRFGYHEKFVREYLETKNARFVRRKSKPPRLLEFANRSNYVAGWKGMLWRTLNKIDQLRGQQAWLQLEFEKR